MLRPPAFDSLRDTPLPHDEQLLDLVGALLEGAMRRQLWLLFLDREERPLPLLLPSDIPRRPRVGDEERMARFVGEVAREIGAGAFVHVYERRGADSLGADDRAWLRLGATVAALTGLRHRGPVLLHDGGARWIGEEDVLAPSPGA
jgi:hypothetical protein